MTAVLDINDCELSLWQDDRLVLSSPGYALLDGKDYRFGQAAREQARLHPRSVHHRFWWQLSIDPLQPAFGPGRHTADLVHGHLTDIFEQGQRPEQLVLAVPGSMNTDQLSLLLGIIEQCPFDVVGLVDRAIGASASTALQQQSWQLDLQLHQALLTEIHIADGHAQRGPSTPIPGAGWLALQDAISNAIADAFIRQTRFDPRRKADTEQLLYDQLPQILADLTQQTEIDLDLGGHRARLERDAIHQACAGHSDRIIRSITDHQAQLLLDPRLALLPGLKEQLPGSEVLGGDAVAKGVSEHLSLIAGAAGDVRYITRLPARSAAITPAPIPQPAPEPVPEPEPEPSHFGLHYRDGQYFFEPGEGPAPLLNGEPLTSPKQLKPGDRLQLDGVPELQLGPVTDNGS